MTWGALGTLILLNVVGSLSPGPDTFFMLRLATRSRAHALAGMAGIITGLAVWVSLTVVGAAALLSSYPSILGLIQVVGGSYLCSMGVRMGTSAWAELTRARAFGFGEGARPVPDAHGSLGTLRQVYRQGVATNLSNPKVVMYFAAILAPLMPAHPRPLLAIGLTLLILVQTAAVFGTLCLVVSTERVRKAVLRAGPVFDLIAGVVFTGVGATLLVEGAEYLLRLW
ncbi:LysE family translocator [Corynebacterium pacaense]|uniref:LysE family translocator n=1 Tax=Corynebacterium pacaense TaxID=1816684 RepID=UPI0009BA3D8D|nr:LysE family translocator [Corynebacterium pacaense]